MHHQLVAHAVLVAHEHHQIAAGGHRIGDMGRPDQADMDFTGEHRLRRPAGDDEHRFEFDVVLGEQSLLARHPSRSHVGVDGAVGEHRFGGRIPPRQQ